MKSIIGATIGALLSLCFFWLGGFDFNERGIDAVVCSIITISFAVIGWLASKLTEGE